MDLHFELWGDNGPPVLVLHGLFGASSNWRTVGKRLAARFSVYLVDQRNHGRSPHAESLRYSDLAADVLSLLDRLGLASVAVIGHSMGGKTAMTLALENPSRVSHLVVVDIAPTRQSNGLRAVLDAMLAVDPSGAASRERVDRDLAERISDATLRRFLLTNLARSPDGSLYWRINLRAIDAHLAELAGPVDSPRAYLGPTLFVRGDRSDCVRDVDRPTIERLFPAAEIITVADAGHWLHAEVPDAFVEIVTRFLSRSTRSD